MRLVSVGMLAAGCFFFSPAEAQLLKKLKQKAEQVMGTDNSANQQNNGNNNQPVGMQGQGGSNSNNPSNRGGGGLVVTPPDVIENIGTAETVLNQGRYSEARYAVQQAMLGVEMQIGQQILKSLPETVSEMKADPKSDQVTSTGWGWVGLTIKREYNKDDKELRFSIANNAAWMQAINLYFNNVGYAQTTGGQQNWKQTRMKGYRAVIEYSDGAGYKLSTPLGQTSLLVYEGINFDSEQEFMKACEAIDIDSIKTKLGEEIITTNKRNFMKQIVLLTFFLFAITAVQAQKKPAAKNSAPTKATPAIQKTTSPAGNQSAAQSVYLVTGSPESFKKLAVDARSQFDAGKLDDSRFALQQMLAELDMIIGKEVLKVLPATLMDKAIVAKQDNVSGATGWLGVIIHREYGIEDSSTSDEANKNISVEIISNSPLVSSINALLSLPMGLGNAGDNRIIKVAGYKALISKSGSDSEMNYELQLPLSSSLITVKAPGATEDQVAQIASKLPVDQIAKMLQ